MNSRKSGITEKRLWSEGFSLLELMVAMTVLILLISLVITIMNGATAATTTSSAHRDADSQARMVFDRLADDLASMPKQADIDFFFSKQDSDLGGVNDQLYFYSGVPGYFDSSRSTALQSPTSLIAYRLDSKLTLERMAKGMTWINAGTSSGLIFLTLSGTTFAPDPQSTLSGNASLQRVLDGSDADYAPFSKSVFRLEFCYYLKNGTYSKIPTAGGTGFKSNLSASSAPDISDDTSKGYSSGSRWYDATGKRAYICQNADGGAAVWSPLGLADVSSLVVAIAVLDEMSRTRAADLALAAQALPDPSNDDLAASPPRLMAYQWQNILNQPDFAGKAGISQSVSARIQIYQRHFKLSTP